MEGATLSSPPRCAGGWRPASTRRSPVSRCPERVTPTTSSPAVSPSTARSTTSWSARVIGLMAELARRAAERYRVRFAACRPVVESGYWTAMMTDWGRWWPAAGTEGRFAWWELFGVVGRMLVAMARAVREADPDTP